MKITNMFIDQSKEIRERIEGMVAYDCITNYVEYIRINDTKDFEKEYIKKLQNRSEKFITGLLCMQYKDYSSEKLLEVIKDLLWNGAYALYDESTDDLIYDITSKITDGEAYPHIKKEMLSALDELIEEQTRTQKEEELRKAKALVSSLEEDLERYTEQMANATKSLAKAKAQLEELTEINNPYKAAAK